MSPRFKSFEEADAGFVAAEAPASPREGEASFAGAAATSVALGAAAGRDAADASADTADDAADDADDAPGSDGATVERLRGCGGSTAAVFAEGAAASGETEALVP